MNIFKRKMVSLSLSITLLLTSFSLTLPVLAAGPLPNQAAILSTARLVDDYWIKTHLASGAYSWDESVYHVGNLAVFDATQDLTYYDYTNGHSQKHNWLMNGGTFSRNADQQIIGQIYLSQNQYAPAENKTIDTKANMDTVVAGVPVNDWTWIDAIFMAMPVYSKLGNLYSSTTYFDKMYQMYNYPKVTLGLYDTTSHLWYRDASYKYPAAKTPNNQKIFWSRGNGWVFAALAKILDEVPVTDPHYSEYLTVFQAMAAALLTRQRTDGFWNSSLDDPNHFGGPETSGTAAFTYGMALGIRKGILSSATYLPAVTNAWNGMASIAVHPDGFLGYVQQGAGSPGSTSYTQSYNFGVGLYLLAASEVVKLATDYSAPSPVTIPAYETTATENIAFNKAVTYSSQTAGFEASHLVDVNTTSRWSATNYPQWAQIDLGTNMPVAATQLFPYSDRAYQYKIETSVDGVNYTLAIDKTANTTGGFVQKDILGLNARYLKLTITGASGYAGTEVGINEFKVQMANLALGKTVAFSSQQAGNEASHIVDGDTAASRWSASTYPQWIQVDLGSKRFISKTEMYPAFLRAYQYKIETSQDGVNYQLLADKTANAVEGYVLTDAFVPTLARYVRLTITGAAGYGGGWASINEFKAFSVTPTNQGLGSTITASSSVESTGWGKAKVLDGNRNSIATTDGWSSDLSISVNHSTEWIQFDMGAAKSISQVSMYPRNDGVNTGYGFPVNFTILTSLDGLAWSTPITRTAYVLPGNSVQSFPFPTSSARYVKISASSLRSNPNDLNRFRMQFAEVEIY